MIEHLLGLAVALPLLGFISWTWVQHVVPERRLHQCQNEIRRLETEIYGQVMSGSLVQEEDHQELERFIDGMASALRPRQAPRKVPRPPGWQGERSRDAVRQVVQEHEREAARRRRQAKYQQLMVKTAWEKQNHAWSMKGYCAMCGRHHSQHRSKVHHLR